MIRDAIDSKSKYKELDSHPHTDSRGDDQEHELEFDIDEDYYIAIVNRTLSSVCTALSIKGANAIIRALS